MYCIYRAPGLWANANTFSFIGADGDQVEGIISESISKLALMSHVSDWQLLKEVDNPANNEVNLVWSFRPIVDELVYRPSFYGGIICIPPPDIWVWKRMLSPAAQTIIEAMPEIFGPPSRESEAE